LVFYQLISGGLGDSAPKAAEFSVVAAARNLPRGTRLTAGDLTVTRWAGEEQPTGAYTEAGELAGRLVERDVREGEPIFESGLAGPGKAAGAGAIPPGMRAVSIHLAEFAGVAKIIENGDRVDVLAADADRRPGNLGARVHTVLQGVQVLDAGKNEEPGSRRGGTPVLTVLVEAKDAETLTLADQAGAIRVVLRNPLDNAVEESGGASWQDVVSSRPGTANREQAQARPARNVSQVTQPAAPHARQLAARAAGIKAGIDMVMPDLHSRLPEATQPAVQPVAPDAGGGATSVLLAVTFAGLGDEALAELTAGLANRFTNAPMILSAFRTGWDLQGRVRALQQRQRLEVFADPNLLAIEQTEARFERALDTSAGGSANQPRHAQAAGCADRIGMRVSFVPTIGKENKLRIRVTSEVAVPGAAPAGTGGDCAGHVAVREWSGEIELADGQGFWIRGLIDRPGAWDLLRKLFPQRPLEHNRNDELAILVTPTLVNGDKGGQPLAAAVPR
jgi:pilus assembly protein CpaB